MAAKVFEKSAEETAFRAVLKEVYESGKNSVAVLWADAALSARFQETLYAFLLKDVLGSAAAGVKLRALCACLLYTSPSPRGASLAGEENTERAVLGEMMSADMVQAVYETLHDRPDELFAFAHKQSEGQMDCKTLLKTLRRLRTPEKVYLDAMALLGAAAQNKAEWDEKALLRLERILKMDDCRAAAELSACANRAKTRLKKSAALLAMR